MKCELCGHGEERHKYEKQGEVFFGKCRTCKRDCYGEVGDVIPKG